MSCSKKLTIILGPTAVGKTGYAISVAQKKGVPIVNCDSRQVYKELKIGTAAPTLEEQRGVKHYLLQTHSILEHYTAGLYEIEALEILERLFKEYDNVIMCGGSGLYIDALCGGLDDFPKADLELRKWLAQRLENEGLTSLVEELKEKDKASFYTIDISNPQRVIRALEVTLQTGRKFSQWKTGSGEGLPQKRRPFEIEKIGLTRSRSELYERINLRVDKMIEQGLLEEARSLYPLRDKAEVLRKTVGYRELFDYLSGATDLETAVDLIKRNTRHYAKRQLTWWRRDPSIKWITL